MVTKKTTDVVTTNDDTATPDSRNLYQRLAAARRNFGKITKNKTNPHFKSKFADLDSVVAAVEPALAAEGVLLVGVCQPMSSEAWYVGYRLVNVDNPEDKTEQVIPSTQYDPQKQGQAITYCRRYVLSLMLNLVTDEDDDGNSASVVGPAPAQTAKTKQPAEAVLAPDDDW